MTRLAHFGFEWFLSERVTGVRHSDGGAWSAKLKRDLLGAFEHPPERKVTFLSPVEESLAENCQGDTSRAQTQAVDFGWCPCRLCSIIPR